MKVTYIQIFKIGIMLGAGLEVGKILPHVIESVLSKKARNSYKDAYRRGGASYECKKARKDYAGPTVVQETPTPGA